MMPLKSTNLIIAFLLGLVLLDARVFAQTERGPAFQESSSTAAQSPTRALGKTVSTNSPAPGGYQPISFETLAAFSIKVDWLVNATNSNHDTLQTEGEIPDDIKALNGKKVSVQGYIKPLKQDDSGVRDFLLMRNHVLCCQTNVPQINEWVHVRMTGRSIPFIHERQFTVRGVLQVGELLGVGNVVSVYRLIGDEINAVPQAP